MKDTFLCAAAGQHLECGAIITILHASHQPAASGTGSAEGRKLINELMIYGDREKIENRDANRDSLVLWRI